MAKCGQKRRSDMNFFGLKDINKDDAKNYNPQVLAFVGDGVYTMFVRNLIVLNNSGKSGALHKLTASYVRAKTQSEIIEKLLPIFTEEEVSVFKRGRNYKTQSTAKNSSVQEYHRATGFEAVLGYLYISGQNERLNEILNLSIGETR